MVFASALSPFYTAFARLLEKAYLIWPSYAGSIVLFTVVIMLVLTPLTLKGTRSMLALQQLQPEMKKLQNRYKDDRQKLNEEMMKFYQENKISPLGGCLPMLIQLPIFWLLYEVLLGLTRRLPYGSDMGSAIACQAGGVGNVCQHGIVQTAGYFNPKYIATSSKLFHNLSSTREMLSLGVDLSQSSLKALGGGIGHALPYIIMVIVVVATTYIQQVQIQRRTPASAVNPTQQLTMKIMPVAMGVIYLVIPAGVVVYFLVSNFFRIGQQALVTRTVYAPAGAIPTTATEVDDEDAPPKKKKTIRDSFIPGEASLPRVGKRARPNGPTAEAIKEPAASVPANRSTKPPAKAKAPKQTASSNGKTPSPAPASAKSKSGTAAPSRKSPSAPTRKSPAPPQRSRKKN